MGAVSNCASFNVSGFIFEIFRQTHADHEFAAVPLPPSEMNFALRQKSPCGGDNIYDVYGTNLANITAWISKNATKKNGITITAATAVPANKTIELTLDTADPDYPAVASKLTIELNTAAILAAAPILMVGYEGANILTQTV